MDYLAQLQKGINYIETRLDGPIALEDVAREAGMSQWHFQRIFKALTNETLKTYIRLRRLSMAFEKIISTDARLIDVALEAGFESQESFTRAFHTVFGITPAEARKLKHRNPFIEKVELSADYLKHINTQVSLEPQIIQKPAMTLIGMRTRFYGVESDKNNIADKLPPLWDVFLARRSEVDHMIAGVGYGVVQQSVDDTDELEYLAATPVHCVDKIPQDMEVLKLPAAKYARFSHRGLAREINNTVNYVYSNWLLTSGHRHTNEADIEVYGEFYQPDSEHSLIHYEIPIA